jgi:hypothetical protein
MLARLNFIAKHTSQTIKILSFNQVISSEQFVMKQQPKKEINF